MRSRIGGLLPRSRMGAFTGLAVLLAALPVWTLPLALLGRSGFAAYLALSSAYYGAPRTVFGGVHFARGEFGIIPASGAAHALAAALYVALALLLCRLVPLREAR